MKEEARDHAEVDPEYVDFGVKLIKQISPLAAKFHSDVEDGWTRESSTIAPKESCCSVQG